MKIQNFNISLISNYDKKLFNINKKFFKLFVNNKEEFSNPKIKIILIKKKSNLGFIFKFHFIGSIKLICDISSKKFLFIINENKNLNIIFDKYLDLNNDKYIILPFNYRIINISQFIYDSIMLMLPLKKIDPTIKYNYN
ncbi:MAG: DUF177 domain-containing protein [Candidatus Shikimatogenerans bostrichidophilus]|nr:MAG: DUF177 domain-containing protein [Candidatus Shikimatogenerans bostrichidophilus]